MQNEKCKMQNAKGISQIGHVAAPTCSAARCIRAFFILHSCNLAFSLRAVCRPLRLRRRRAARSSFPSTSSRSSTTAATARWWATWSGRSSPRGRVHHSRVDARRARLLHEPQSEAVAGNGPGEDEEDRPGRFRRADRHLGERGAVPGAEGEIYDLVIKCVDFSAQPQPKVIYEVKARTNRSAKSRTCTSSRCSMRCTAGSPAGRRRPIRLAEENWKKNPNLVAGDFEHGSGGVPKGWDNGRRAAARAAGRAGPLDRRGGQSAATGSSASRSISTSPRTRA